MNIVLPLGDGVVISAERIRSDTCRFTASFGHENEQPNTCEFLLLPGQLRDVVIMFTAMLESVESDE